MPVQQSQQSELGKPAAHQSSQDDKGFFISEMQGWLKYENPINILYHIEGKKENTSVSISINTDKAFNKFQHPFIIYISLNKLRKRKLGQHNGNHNLKPMVTVTHSE